MNCCWPNLGLCPNHGVVEASRRALHPLLPPLPFTLLSSSSFFPSFPFFPCADLEMRNQSLGKWRVSYSTLLWQQSEKPRTQGAVFVARRKTVGCSSGFQRANCDRSWRIPNCWRGLPPKRHLKPNVWPWKGEVTIKVSGRAVIYRITKIIGKKNWAWRWKEVQPREKEKKRK